MPYSTAEEAHSSLTHTNVTKRQDQEHTWRADTGRVHISTSAQLTQRSVWRCACDHAWLAWHARCTYTRCASGEKGCKCSHGPCNSFSVHSCVGSRAMRGPFSCANVWKRSRRLGATLPRVPILMCPFGIPGPFPSTFLSAIMLMLRVTPGCTRSMSAAPPFVCSTAPMSHSALPRTSSRPVSLA